MKKLYLSMQCLAMARMDATIMQERMNLQPNLQRVVILLAVQPQDCMLGKTEASLLAIILHN